MTIPLLIYVGLFLFIMCLNMKMRHTFFDTFLFVVGPFVAIILLNNVFIVKLGFIEIPAYIITMHTVAMLVFYLGTCFSQHLYPRINSQRVVRYDSLSDYSIKTLLWIISVCELIIIIDDLIRLRRFGPLNFINGGEAFGSSSIAAHLSRLLVPLLIILYDFYCEKKVKKYLVNLGIGLILLFATFIKYHVIGAVLSIFIYVAIKRPDLIRKLGLIVIGMVISLFVVNYMLTFMAYRVNVSNEFYFQHLWQYIAGGTINIDTAIQYFNNSPDKHLSIIEWIWEMLSSFPSMITRGLFGWRITEYNFSYMIPFFDIGGFSRANVLSIPGAAFIQAGYSGLTFFVFISGIIVQYIFLKAKNTKSVSVLTSASIFLSYCLLSFFSSFFELTGPWETIFWSIVIIPVLKMKIKNGRIIYRKLKLRGKRYF